MRTLLITMLLIVMLFSVAACDEKETFNDIADVAMPILIDTYNDTRADSRVMRAYVHEGGGWNAVGDVVPELFAEHLKSNLGEMNLKDLGEREAYLWMQDNMPTLALIVYREGEDGPEGLWVLFDQWAKSHGYEEAYIYLLVEMSDEDSQALLPLALEAAAEQYEIVMQLPGIKLQGLEIGEPDY